MSNDTVINIERQPRLTAYGLILQAARNSGLPMIYIDQTSLNEKLGIFPEEVVDNSIVPATDWFGIGWGSTYTRPTPEGINEVVNYVHDPLDADLFHSLPLLIRKQGQDNLTPEERQNYSGRALFNHEGETLVGYYLKKVDRSQTAIIAEIVVPPSTPNGTEQVTPLEGDPRYLNPTPVELSDATQRKDGAYVRVRAPLALTFSAWEMDELLNAKQIMTKSSQLEVTEIGLFSGVAKTKTVTDADNTITYTEVMNAQLNLASPLRFIANDRVGRSTSLTQEMGVNSPTNFKLPF